MGYNGRQPGVADADGKNRDKGERDRSGEEEPVVNGEDRPDNAGRGHGMHLTGGDARHTVVAYFQILELSCLVEIPREITNFAVRIFRHTAARTSLRNRNVEALATASLVCAVERTKYLSGPESVAETVTLKAIAKAASLTEKEVERYLRLVNNAMQRQRPETSASIAVHMPSFCRKLGLSEDVQTCALGIADMVLERNMCQRRNPMSISAAAIYLACQLEDQKKTQLEICKVTGLTEVTLRKVSAARRDDIFTPWEASSGLAADVVQRRRRPGQQGTRPEHQPHHSRMVQAQGGPDADGSEQYQERIHAVRTVSGEGEHSAPCLQSWGGICPVSTGALVDALL